MGSIFNRCQFRLILHLFPSLLRQTSFVILAEFVKVVLLSLCPGSHCCISNRRMSPAICRLIIREFRTEVICIRQGWFAAARVSAWKIRFLPLILNYLIYKPATQHEQQLLTVFESLNFCTKTVPAPKCADVHLKYIVVKIL